MSEPKKPKRYPVLDLPPKKVERFPVLDTPEPMAEIIPFGPRVPGKPPEPKPPRALLGSYLDSSEPLEGKPERLEEEVRRRASETAQEGGDPKWDALLDQAMVASCAFFAQEVLTGPPEEPYFGRFMVSEHHESWDELIGKYKRICVLASRDHGKIYFFDFAYPLWKAWCLPGGCGYIFSATAPQAERILEDIKTEIESNPRLQYLRPKKHRKWGSRYIRLANGHRIYARGFGSRVRGAHPNYLVIDDSLNDETIYSEMVRQKQIEYFFTAITNMVVPGGQIIVVGTPFHSADLYGSLRTNPEYAFRKYAALKADGSPLWPERYGAERLAQKRREIGSIRFTREFMCDPVSDDMSLFPYRLFRGDPTEQMQLRLGMAAEFWKTLGVQIFMGVDFAISSSVEADFFVIWVVGVDKHQNRWLIDIKREKGLSYQDQLSLINSTARKYDVVLIFLESNQMQRIFGNELIRLTDLPIKEFITGVQKNSLEKGVPSLRVLFENCKYRIPRGDAHSIEMTDLWIEEMRSFTFHEGKLQSVGKHDDTVMACWICDQAIRHGAFSFTFDADTDKIDIKALMAELTGEVPEENNRAGISEGPARVTQPNLVDESFETLPLGVIPTGDTIRLFG